MSFSSWLVQHIVYPCGPFVLGLVFRFIAIRRPSLECFGTIELTLSMATISLLMLTLTVAGLRRREDKILARTVSCVYSITAVCFAGFFAIATYFETKLFRAVATVLPLLSKSVSVPGGVANLFGDTPSELHLLRYISLGFSAVLVFGTIWAARRLNFTD